MKHRPDTRGFLYFMIAVLTVWSGELANLGGAELYQRIADRWPALAIGFGGRCAAIAFRLVFSGAYRA